MEESKEKKSKMILVPIVSVAAFLLLMFGAGYAYFSSSIAYNNAVYSINLPTQTALMCTKTDCNADITPEQMVNTVSSNSEAKNTSTCYISCTCSGTEGATCNYRIALNTTGNTYTPTSGLGSGKEFTVEVSGCNAPTANNTTYQSAATEVQVSSAADKIVSVCNLTVGTNATANVTAKFRWYNVEGLDQTTAQAGKSYSYTLSSVE